eukprot:gene16226-22390_t
MSGRVVEFSANDPGNQSDENGNLHQHKKQRRDLENGKRTGMQSKAKELLKIRKQLPIWSARTKLLEMVRANPSMVVVGETGSGKTTQIPQFLLEGGLAGHKGAIACTQPRRVAAVSMARRVAEEMGVQLGQEVGYSIRFDDTSSAQTRIKYLTDGMLLREALIDPKLEKYKVVIVDEAHERTVQTDVLLGLLKNVQQLRGIDFRLIVMSATLDTEKYMAYFPGAQAAYVQGRTYPVDILFTATAEDNYLDAALTAALQVHTDEPPGDILLFLTGQDEIESLEKLLNDRVGSSSAAVQRTIEASSQRGSATEGGETSSSRADEKLKLMVVPIYSSLPPEQQMKVFDPAPKGYRKCILATNIAETSLTIGGVRYVIDTGFVKTRGYNAKMGAESLQVVPVSKAQARQRSREAPGRAYRLYMERSFDDLEATTLPEIMRSNLGVVVLQLKAMGVEDVLGFDFMDPPPRAAIIRSLELLFALGALDTKGDLTDEIGKSMARLPVEPMYGRVLLAAGKSGCSVEAMQVVAMVSADNIFFAPRNKREESNAARMKFAHRSGDHLTLLAVYKGFIEIAPKKQATWCSDNFVNVRSLRRAADICAQLERHLVQLGIPIKSCGDNDEALRRVLVAGLFPHAARRGLDGTFKVIATGQQIFIHPSSILCGKKPECFLYDEMVRTTKQYVRGLTTIEPRWLPEIAPSFFRMPAEANQ